MAPGSMLTTSLAGVVPLLGLTINHPGAALLAVPASTWTVKLEGAPAVPRIVSDRGADESPASEPANEILDSEAWNGGAWLLIVIWNWLFAVIGELSVTA